MLKKGKKMKKNRLGGGGPAPEPLLASGSWGLRP